MSPAPVPGSPDPATPAPDASTPEEPDAVAVPADTPAPGAVSGFGAYGELLAINVNPVFIFVMRSGDIIVPSFM